MTNSNSIGLSSTPSILAIETATSACSVALRVGEALFAGAEIGNNIHSQRLLEMVSDVLLQAQISATKLDAVAVGQGPGSFTGLRIGVGVAQGLAYGAECRMIGISSLDALANQASSGRIIATIDARMGEAYWCEYLKSEGVLERITELQVSAPADIVSASLDELTLVGNAWQEYQGQFNDRLISRATLNQQQTHPSASSLLDLALLAYQRGDLIEAIDFAPEYVRNDVAKKSAAKKSTKQIS